MGCFGLIWGVDCRGESLGMVALFCCGAAEGNSLSLAPAARDSSLEREPFVVPPGQLGSEKEAFDITDVLNSICEKLKYRHPHIYGEVKVDSAEEVLQNWEQLKLKEKGRKHRVLEGVPVSLPALVKTYRIQDKARGAGFDWKQKEEVWTKVKEELQEFETEIAKADQEKMEQEFGDFLFSIINVARLYGINPENALEKTNRKFIRRFGYVEDKAKETGKNLSDMSLEEMEVYWQEAKGREQK